MLGALFTVLFWTPVKEEFYVVFILATIFGLGVAVNNPIVIGEYPASVINLVVKNSKSDYVLLHIMFE